MAPWLPSGRIRAHEHERGGFSAGASGRINQRWANERIMKNYPMKVITFKTFSLLCIQCRFEKVDLIQGWAQGKKKNPEVKIQGAHRGGSGGLRPPEAEENTIFFTLKMQFQGISTHKLLGLSTNATPKLLPKL